MIPSSAPPLLVLASSSPRRLALLARLGLVPQRTVIPAIDETPAPGETPRAYVVRMAREKAEAVSCAPDEIVLAGDTCIALGRCILPPADDLVVQRALLSRLSGRRHCVWSAVCLRRPAGHVRLRIARTTLAFKPLSPDEIEAYLNSGEGLGKAGGYAIQGRAEAWVRHLAGSHSGVIGLPLFETRALLATAGLLPA